MRSVDIDVNCNSCGMYSTLGSGLLDGKDDIVVMSSDEHEMLLKYEVACRWREEQFRRIQGINLPGNPLDVVRESIVYVCD